MDRIKTRKIDPKILLLIFQLLSFSLLLMSVPEIDNKLIYGGLGIIGLMYGFNYIINKISTGDSYIFLITTMMFSIGIMMIYRLNPYLGRRQLIWIVVGMFSFLVTYLVMKKITIWDKLTYFYAGLIYLLFALTFLLGTRTKGAINWIDFGFITFQPGEIIKILLVFLLASYYGGPSEIRKNKKSSYYMSLVVYSYLLLFFLQRDLGMAVLMYGVFISIQYIYEENRYLVYGNIILAILAGILAYFTFAHVQVRFRAWLNPWKYIDTVGYQITQSLFAIAEGGFFGTGLGLGQPGFIPEVHTDFIFSAICEEMGLLTGLGIIMLFIIFIYRGFKISLSQDNLFYRILGLGLSILFGIQSFLILGGILRVIPLTGITLPFISYGGSSMLASFISLAILQVASEVQEVA